jgi:hypothetical protein
MIVRNDITAETYYPLPISGSTGAVGETALAPEHSKAEMCERVKLVLRDHLGRPGRADDGFAILKETLRVHAPDV